MDGPAAAHHLGRMKPVIPALFLLLAGCAQGPGLDQRLSTFVGRSEGELVGELGVPLRVHEADGRRFLQFEQRRGVAVAPPPGYYAPVYGPWGPRFGYWPPSPGVTMATCDLTFALREGRVESFSYRGEGCF
jgi:hypothetical protein